MFARLTLFLFCAFLLVGGREPPWADANVNVVSDVLDMSRLESGSLTLDMLPLYIGDVLEVAVENAGPLFEAKHQSVDLRLEAGLLDISGDPKRLRQLFANLLSHASKFTGEKGRILVMAKASLPAHIGFAALNRHNAPISPSCCGV